ncbi:MAG TPA: undecaprenyl-diphosphate phosphatase [Acidimicrobiia bacterium]|nr:undecaprenyl-diphosphate phosphatase [Acidimicrobiia bacterium]
MLEAIIWGVVQGITEFVPISSDGHLVLVPAFLGIEGPDLTITAVLHLGTLVAVLAYFRRELWSLRRFRTDPDARRLLILLIVGTLPAFFALIVRDRVEELQSSVTVTAALLILNGVILAVGGWIRPRERRLEDARNPDALLIGAIQVLAILPGISRSGVTITAGLARGFDRVEAARFSFLLGVPAVTGAGLLELRTLVTSSGLEAPILVGVLVAAVTGYAAIAFLLRMLARIGLWPYAVYCLVVGVVALAVL